MTRALWTAILGGALILTALAFGPTPLLVPGVGLLVLVAVASLWVGWASRGGLDMRLGTARVVEGEQCPLELEAWTPVGPPPGSELVDPLSDDCVRLLGPRRRVHRVSAQARFARRGLVAVQPARLVLRDPLGLARRELSAPAREMLVLPRVEPVLPVGRGGVTAQGADGVVSLGAAGGAETDLHSLREAAPDASASRIHWPAFARTGTPFERTLTAESARRPLIVLDASRPASPEALDSAVRAAASLCVWLARGGGCELLLPGERRPARVDRNLTGWPALHGRLAVVGPEAPPSALGRSFRGTVFWVAAGAREPRALAPGVAAERYLVTPGPPRAGAVFAVAGCHGRRLGRASTRRAA